MKKLLLITTALFSLSFFAANAQTDNQENEDGEGLFNYKRFLLDKNGKWSVGAGTIIRNSPFRGEKVDVFPVPIVDYSSKNLFIREMKAGYHIHKVKDPYVGGFFFDTYLAARMRPGESRRKFSIDAGLRGGYQNPFGALSASITQDITGASGGKEASVSYSFTYLNQDKDSIIIPRITVTWQDRKMADYLWGISPTTTAKMIRNNDEVILQPYQITKSVINYSAGIIHIYKFDDHWNSILGGQVALLDNKILENPAVERHFDYSFMVGAAYTF